MSQRGKRKLHLTERALADIIAIEVWSDEQFGPKVVAKYLQKIETAIVWLKDNPDLLRPEPEFHKSLQFYRIEKHLLVVECSDLTNLIVLTVINASMDVPSQLLELEPNLKTELEILRKQLAKSSRTST